MVRRRTLQITRPLILNPSHLDLVASALALLGLSLLLTLQAFRRSPSDPSHDPIPPPFLDRRFAKPLCPFSAQDSLAVS